MQMLMPGFLLELQFLINECSFFRGGLNVALCNKYRQEIPEKSPILVSVCVLVKTHIVES